MDRRDVLTGVCTVLGVGTGCLGSDPSAGPPGDATTYDEDDWTRSTDCDGMADSVIEVEWSADDLGDDNAPVRYGDLSDKEQSIARRVVEEGGVGTCEPSAAFERVVDRVKEAAGAQRDGSGDRTMVSLAFDGRYYGLYVEVTDMVISAE